MRSSEPILAELERILNQQLAQQSTFCALELAGPGQTP